jgi:hypothetical protein
MHGQFTGTILQPQALYRNLFSSFVSKTAHRTDPLKVEHCCLCQNWVTSFHKLCLQKIFIGLDHRHHVKKRRLMACTTCIVCLVSSVSGCRKNLLEEQALVAGTKKLEQSTFLRYLWIGRFIFLCITDYKKLTLLAGSMFVER